MIDRTKLIEHIQYAFPELTDEALKGLSAFVDMLPRRPLTSETLAEDQRQREVLCAGCSNGHFDILRPCPACGASAKRKTEMRIARAERDLHDTTTDAAAVIGAAGAAIVYAGELA